MAKLQDVQNTTNTVPAEKKASKKKVDEVVVTPVQIYDALPDIQRVTLNDLIPLNATPIPMAEYAMREINAANLANIRAAIEAGRELPPLKVVPTNYGPIVVDGYHRWTAYQQHLTAVLEESLNEGESVTPEMAEAARKSYPVNVSQVQALNTTEMLDLAFKANLEHGLAASENSRSRYALWLIAINKDAGHPISIREAARRALVSHVAVLKAQKQLAKKMKMVDGYLTPEEQAEADALQPEALNADQKSVEDTERAIRAIAKAVAILRDQEFSDAELEELAAGAIGSGKNVLYKEDIAGIGKFLNYMHKAAKNRPLPQMEPVTVTGPNPTI